MSRAGKIAKPPLTCCCQSSTSHKLAAEGFLLKPRGTRCIEETVGAQRPGQEEALHDVPLYREFAGLSDGASFGMKAHIDVDAASGLVHTVVGTAANVSDINVAGALLHDEEHAAFGDSGYQGVHKRVEAAGPTWHVAMRPGRRRLLNPFIESEFVAERVEKMKASIRAKVEHPFRVIKQQFGFTTVRYRGLMKNTEQIVTLFALSNLWMARRPLMGARG